METPAIYSFICVSLFLLLINRVIETKSFSFFFLGVQSMFYMPIAFLVDYSNDLHIMFLIMHTVFFVILVFSSIFFNARLANHKHELVYTKDPNRKFPKILVIFIVSLIATVLYYRANGGLIFSRIAEGEHVAALRLSYYSTGEYTYAGYANQFKNILLPMTSVLIITRIPKRWLWVAIPIFAVLIVISTTGTGQRAPLMHASLGILVFSMKYYNFKIDIKRIILLFILIQLFGLMSAFLGRVGEFSVLGSLIELLERRFLVNQTGNLTTFYYVVDRGFVYGADWFQDILSLAPSIKPHTLPRELFAILWGSAFRGNSPESLVTSLYFNFGIPGLLLMPIILSYLVYKIEVRARRRNLPATMLMIYSFMAISLGFWVSSTLLYPLNNGILTCLIFILVYASTIRPQQQPMAPPSRIRTSPPPLGGGGL